VFLRDERRYKSVSISLLGSVSPAGRGIAGLTEPRDTPSAASGGGRDHPPLVSDGEEPPEVGSADHEGARGSPPKGQTAAVWIRLCQVLFQSTPWTPGVATLCKRRLVAHRCRPFRRLRLAPTGLPDWFRPRTSTDRLVVFLSGPIPDNLGNNLSAALARAHSDPPNRAALSNRCSVTVQTARWIRTRASSHRLLAPGPPSLGESP
jgi:hypothetical protein